MCSPCMPRKPSSAMACRGIGEQPRLVVRIGPRPRHHLRTVAWSDLVLVEIEDRVDGVRIDHPAIRQQSLQCLHPQRHGRGGMLMIVAHGRSSGRVRDACLSGRGDGPRWLRSTQNTISDGGGGAGHRPLRSLGHSLHRESRHRRAVGDDRQRELRSRRGGGRRPCHAGHLCRRPGIPGREGDDDRSEGADRS